MDDLLQDFLTESNENLAKLDNDIVELERTPHDTARLHGVFRTIHTMKGTCGFLGLPRLEGVAHAAENVLDALRAGRLEVTPALIGDVLAAVDCIKAVLARLAADEVEPTGDDSALIATLERWIAPTGSAAAAPVPDVLIAPLVPLPLPVVVPSAPADAPTSAGRGGWDGIERRGSGDGAGDPHHAVADSTLRVGIDVLDKLMNLVGELALGRNQLLQLAASNEESPFSKPVQQLDRVTTELLEAVMKTRMQPIGNAWTKLPRLVRDLSNSSGRAITLEMHGAETELDRQILQAITDPLTHMVRNSADHGIEPATVRVAAGKPAGGTIHLSARHEGGHVLIEIRDDGAGIDANRIRRKAVERGLVRAEAADSLSEAQVLRLIFEPGFSTAEVVTNVSGRGVGMDVVRSNIEGIGGTVELASTVGAGTLVRIKIPLTLAIISALLVGTAGETFAVPQIGIVELVRVTEEQASLIEQVHGTRFYRLRDTLLPLVSLRTILALGDEDEMDACNIVVCQVGEVRFGLVVAEVFDTQEIVVKPVGRLVKHLSAYTGCTITGDGRVIMILDTAGLADMARVVHDPRAGDGQAAAAAQRARDAATAHGTESVLLFEVGAGALQAVPLALVARLEEFPLSSLEEADGQHVVQYRGSLMPIVAARAGMDMRSMDPRPVIVFSDRHRTMGLAVDAIRDIVEEQLVLQRRATRAGVLGVAVLSGRATEVIDTDHFLRLAHGDGDVTDAAARVTAVTP
ncbi:MAG: chemotaxis protein CheA [Gemmatimonadaceae bacterium]|nr:chemotaxis protein CheA [Gemmatimonadaceae bacterium]